jgi:hypothetical protein
MRERTQWRVTLTDSESLTGVAPVCTQPGSDALHEIPDYPGGPKRDEDGVYDCCPWPQFDTYSEATAAYLVALLNADSADSAEAWRGELDHLRTLTTTLTAAAEAGNLPAIRKQLAAHQRIDTARRTEAHAANGGGR